MDDVDRYIQGSERDAARSSSRSPTRTNTGPQSPLPAEYETRLSTVTSSSSGTTTTSSHASGHHVEGAISRIQTTNTLRSQKTQRDIERHPTALQRIETAKSQHATTVGKSPKSREPKEPLPPFGDGKPYPPQLDDQEDYVVEYDGPADPLHPQNWPFNKKLRIGIILGYTTLVCAFGSSIFSAAVPPVSLEFGVSSEVALLGLSFYVLGFAFGPILWGPLSELKGRRPPLLFGMFGFSIFTVATATAKDLQTVLLTRLFAGLFASCPLAVVAAVFSDMFSHRTRGLAITVFSMMVFSSPLMAPFIGGFIVTSYLGWRWTQYLISIMGWLAFGLDFFFLTETYPPAVLVGKAEMLRRRTRNWGIHAKQEEIEVDFKELVEKNFSRPIRILSTEPIVFMLSLYMAFIYGLLYLFLTGYAVVFQQIHQFSPGVGGLPYFGMIIGMFLAGIYIASGQPAYNKKLAANDGVPIPEWRLPPIIVGGVAFAGGLFWFGWSGYRADIHWIVPTLSGLLTGFGLLAIFLQSLNYIIDAYLMFAASAIAANTFLRSLAGAGFPLFATYMFQALGVQWAGTLLGCVACLLIPIPIIFYKYGAKIRKRSKFAPKIPKMAIPNDDEEKAMESGSGGSVKEMEAGGTVHIPPQETRRTIGEQSTKKDE